MRTCSVCHWPRAVDRQCRHRDRRQDVPAKRSADVQCSPPDTNCWPWPFPSKYRRLLWLQHRQECRKKPAFAPDNEGSYRIFHLVVADFDFTMVEKGAKKLLLVQSVGRGFIQLVGGTRDFLYPGIVFVNDRLRLILALCLPIRDYTAP